MGSAGVFETYGLPADEISSSKPLTIVTAVIVVCNEVACQGDKKSLRVSVSGGLT